MKVDNFLSGITLDTLNPSYEQCLDLLDLRIETFRGFAEIEEGRGFVQPKASFSTSKGQEMLRILLFRVIEEASESYDSVDLTHAKEEAIDAVNYLMSALLLDTAFFSREVLAADLLHVAEAVFGSRGHVRVSTTIGQMSLGSLSYHIAGTLADTFRNRAWMEQSQAPYFEGAITAREVFRKVLVILLQVFESWEEFYKFFTAKDMVLQFRLSTKY